jgi:hypothetical protein
MGYLDGKDILGWAYRMATPLIAEATPTMKEIGIDIDPSFLPKPETIENHLFGMVTALTANDDGVLMVSHAPLPLPTPTARSAALVGAIALGVTLGDQAMEDTALADLRAISKACHVYAARHQEKFPQTLDVLAAENLLPSGASVYAAYEYVPGLTPYDPPWCVLAYDDEAKAKGAANVRVLLVTGKCTRMPTEELTKALEKVQGRLATKPAATTQTGTQP